VEGVMNEAVSCAKTGFSPWSKEGLKRLEKFIDPKNLV
jgi:hypothetical protein